MPKTDINSIIKHGAKSKANIVDYTTPQMKAKLKKRREEHSKQNYQHGKWHPPIIITI